MKKTKFSFGLLSIVIASFIINSCSIPNTAFDFSQAVGFIKQEYVGDIPHYSLVMMVSVNSADLEEATITKGGFPLASRIVNGYIIEVLENKSLEADDLNGQYVITAINSKNEQIQMSVNINARLNSLPLEPLVVDAFNFEIASGSLSVSMATNDTPTHYGFFFNPVMSGIPEDSYILCDQTYQEKTSGDTQSVVIQFEQANLVNYSYLRVYPAAMYVEGNYTPIILLGEGKKLRHNSSSLE